MLAFELVQPRQIPAEAHVGTEAKWMVFEVQPGLADPIVGLSPSGTNPLSLYRVADSSLQGLEFFAPSLAALEAEGESRARQAVPGPIPTVSRR